MFKSICKNNIIKFNKKSNPIDMDRLGLLSHTSVSIVGETRRKCSMPSSRKLQAE